MPAASEGFLGPDLMAAGNWAAFERAVCRLLVHRGFEWVRITAGPGDRGSDIVGYYRGEYWVAQVKFSLGQTPPGPGVINEIAHAVNEYHATRALLATNASLTDASPLRIAAAEFAEQVGVPIRLLDRRGLLRELDVLPGDPVALAARPIRDYQKEAVDSIRQAARTRAGRQAGALVAMATGTGKSRVLFEYIRAYLDSAPTSEALVLAESVELARQLERTSWEVLPKTVTTQLWAGGATPSYRVGNAVVFATTDSVRAGWGILVRASRFPLVVFDEAHHAAAPGNRELMEDLEPVFRLGMTATPWRGDQRRIEAMFGDSPPVYKLSIVDAIARGYLATVKYLVYDDHIDWREVRERSKGRLTIRDLNRILWVPERENRIAEIVREWIDELRHDGQLPRTLVFCRSIEHTTKARIALNAAGVPAAELHSGLAKFDVTRTLQQFRDGDLRVLTVVDMLNEGIDVPDVRLIVFNRVTQSRRVFLQQLGRGLRKAPDKYEVVVLDFVADVRRLRELAEIEHEYEATAKTPEVVNLPPQLVFFRSEEMADFVDAYLSDVGDLDATDDDALMLFPPATGPET